MNGDACKFSHEPLTDESRELLDKVCAVNRNTSLHISYCSATW